MTSKPVDISKAAPVEAGEPVEAPALTQMGATFAERAAAAKKASTKAVKSEDAEDKAVKASESKASRTRKKG